MSGSPTKDSLARADDGVTRDAVLGQQWAEVPGEGVERRLVLPDAEDVAADRPRGTPRDDPRLTADPAGAGLARGNCATLCYMNRVGVRELRQNLSVHLRRVQRGESLAVTEYGRPVAVLAPLPEPAGTRDRLLAAGKFQRARGSLAELGPPPSALNPRASVSGALADERADRI